MSFVDLAPTVLSLAGVSIPDYMDGQAFLGKQAAQPRQYIHGFRDRMDERYDCIRAVRGKRYHYIRNFMPHVTYAQYLWYLYQTPTMQVWQDYADKGLLVGPQKDYFAPIKPVEELYDNGIDPQQTHNLAADPVYTDVLKRMRAELFRWMAETRDLGLMPEYEIACRAKGSTPYEMAHDSAKYPYDRVIEVAKLASRMDAAKLPQLVEKLNDEDAVVRYWAAVGLDALADKASGAADALNKALKDASPNVRLVAADALCRLGSCDQSMPVFTDALKSDSGFIRLRALNLLDNLGAKARPLLPQIRQAGMENDFCSKYIQRVQEHIVSELGA